MKAQRFLLPRRGLLRLPEEVFPQDRADFALHAFLLDVAIDAPGFVHGNDRILSGQPGVKKSACRFSGVSANAFASSGVQAPAKLGRSWT